MEINTGRLLAVVGRLRTPMMLAGLVVVVLYLLFRQVLGSRVLTPMTSEGTFQVVDRIVTGMFVLALVAVTLGFAGFVLAPFLRRAATSRAARVQLVDASVDPQMKVVAGPEAGEITDLSFQHGLLDFKFVNRGTAAAVLHRFDIEVLGVLPDLRPHLSFAYTLVNPLRGARWSGRQLRILADNLGWGDALGCRVSLTHPALTRVFPATAQTAIADIGSGKRQVKVLSLNVADADQAEFRNLTARRARLLSAIATFIESVNPDRLGPNDLRLLGCGPDDLHLLASVERSRLGVVEGDGACVFGSDRRRAVAVESAREAPTDRLPVSPVVTVTYPDGAPDEGLASHPAKGFDRAHLWLCGDRFGCVWDRVLPSVMDSDRAYAVVLEPVTSQKRSYRMSRVIAPGAADRFHILLAARQSGDYTVRLTFHVNDDTVASRSLQVYLKRLRNEPLPRQLVDGASLQLKDGRLVLGGWAWSSETG